MGDISNTETIQVTGTGAIGISLEVAALNSNENWTITNSGTIEATADAGTDGAGVKVTANPSYLTVTGTFVVDNSGVIASLGSGPAINFDILVSSPGSITIINQETGLLAAAIGDAIVIAGDSVDTITNKGAIIGGISTAGGADTFNLFTGSSISGLIDSGLGNDTVNLHGSGQGTLGSFANVEVVNLFSGDWTLGSEDPNILVNFQDGLQTLGLGTTVLADGNFDGTINNFSSGDIIDLTGIGLATNATLGANNILTIAGGSVGPITLQLDPLQNFDGQLFQLTSDGAGGTNINLATATVGVLFTVSAQNPSANVTLTNNGTIEATLDGVLVDADPSNLIATGAFLVDNSGVIESTVSGHAINFDILVSSPGSITIVNQETGLLAAAIGDAIVIAGDSVDTITNKGAIIGGISTAGGADTFNLFTGSSISGLIDSGLGNDTVNLHGSGQGTLGSFANVEVVNLFSGDWTLGSEDPNILVNFQDGLQTLGLGTTVLADGNFDGTINNFSSGDIIDLTGIGLATNATLGANNILTIAGGSVGPITLQLDPLQNFDGQLFQLTSDGAGGTNINLATAGGGGVVLAGTVGDDTLIGSARNDIISSRDGNDDISGGKGGDTILTGNGSSVLDGGKGDDVLTAGDGDNNVLAGGDGSDILTVGNGNNNLLSGGGGADTLNVGTGNNFLSGGNGKDTFVFGPDSGTNVITDFGHNDQIQFNSVFADFQAVQDASQQVGDNTVISLDADHSLTLVGVSVNSLHASDFILA